MEVQSLSVCVPAKCPNKCEFCVSQMHSNDYPKRLFSDDPFAEADFTDRLEYARDNGVQCVILTGDGEPLMNMPFIEHFGNVNKTLKNPFRHIELQTSGVLLDDDKLNRLRYVGIKTISLSLSALEDDENALYNRTPAKLQFNIAELCEKIKARGFNLRLSLNMTDAMCYSAQGFFAKANALGANQITFRVLYTSGKGQAQDEWIAEHKVPQAVLDDINDYVKLRGTALHRLSFGAMKYDVDGISTVVDADCMNTDVKDTLKYFILRQDCRLYTHWDKKGSLVY